MTDYFDEFMKWLRVERNVSAHTLSSYKTALIRFFEFIGERNPEDINREQLVAWRAEIIKTSDLNTARNRHSAVRTFYKFLALRFGLPNLAREVLPPLREIIRDPMVPSEFEIEKIIAQPDETTHQGMRDSAIMAILASTGIRLGELIALNFGDISKKKDHFEMQVPMEKGYYQRTVPFGNFNNYNDIAANYFGIYWLWLVSEKYDPKKPLFFAMVNRFYGHRFVPSTVRWMIKKYAEQAEMNSSRWNVHSFRHFYGTYAIAHGTSLEDLKQLMGHRDVNTTMRYVHLWQKISAGVALRTSPTANIKTKLTRAGIGKKILKKM